MKQCFTKKCGLMLVLMLFAFVQGAWAEDLKSPSMTLTYEASEVTVGGAFSNPSLKVVEGTTSVRSRFRYTYSIIDQNNNEVTAVTKDEKNKDVVVDPTTGSTVQYRYGIVNIGSKSGKFTIKVTATPTDRWKSTYKTTSTTFAVTVNAAKPTMTVKNGAIAFTADSKTMTLYVGETESYGNRKWNAYTLDIPTVTLTHENDGRTVDDTKQYDITYAITGNYILLNKSNAVITSTSDDKTPVSVKYNLPYNFTKDNIPTTDAEKKGTLTITATPKAKSTLDVGSEVLTFVVDLNTDFLEYGTTDDKKIQTTISFNPNELSHYRMTTDKGEYIRYYDVPVPVIKDANGNDVTKYFDITFGYYDDVNKKFVGGEGKPMNVFKTYSDDPFDNWGTWKYSESDNTNTIKFHGYQYVVNDSRANSFENLKLSTDESQRSPDDYLIEAQAVPGQLFYGSGTDYGAIYAAPKIEDAGTVKGMFYGYEGNGKEKYSNTYALKSNQYIFHVLKHAPELRFSPDPSTIDLANHFEMSPTNRFNVSGVFKDNTLADEPEDTLTLFGQHGFRYCVFIPEENAFSQSDYEANPTGYPTDGNIKVRIVSKNKQGDGTWKETDFDPTMVEANVEQEVPEVDKNGNIVYDEQSGKPNRVLKKGTRYYTKVGYGNDDFFMTFYGKGKLNLDYTIIPYNSETWDPSTSQAITYNIVDKEPTKLVITPKEILTETGVTSEVPEVRVVDQFGKDVTEYFDLTPSTDKSDVTLGTDPNGEGENQKYAVTSSVAGEYPITVTATGKTEGEYMNTHYEVPTSDSYTVIVKNKLSNPLYEVIYDSKEFNESNGLNDHMSGNTLTVNESKMGKLHFINEGSFYAGIASIHEVPGLSIRFGSSDEAKSGYTYNVKKVDDDASLKDNDNDPVTGGKSSRSYLELDNTSIPDGKNVPTSGYILIEPVTNGFLTIDAQFRSKETLGGQSNELWILRDLDDINSEQELSSETTFSGEKRYGLPLLEGHRYALWSDQMDGFIHGLSFDPAFIALATDHEGWHTAVTFQNGYTGALPKLRKESYSTITYYVKDVKTKDDTKVSDITTADDKTGIRNAGGYHASIGENNGRVAAHELSADNSLTEEAGAEMADRVTIVASVKGQRKTIDGKSVYVEKRPHYNLFIGNMPTYIVENGDNFDQGTRLSTNNIPTRIWMTVGGWTHVQDEKYPYQKYDSKTGAMVYDSWKTAKMDSVGRDNMTIDNFNFGTFGDQNPVDEELESWSGFRQAKPWNLGSDGKLASGVTSLDDQRTTFNLPVRGTYLKFEPEESGRLFLYILQNGMSDLSKGDDDNKFNHKDSPQYLRRRAIYIVDETGNNVDIKGGNDGWSEEADKYLPTGQTAATRFPNYTIPNKNYYCDGITRVVWGNTDDSKNGTKKFEIDESPNGKYTWMNAYDHTGSKEAGNMKLTDKGRADLTNDENLIKDWWQSNVYKADGDRTSDWTFSVDGKTRTNKLDGPNEVLRLSDGGFVLPTKGYVRYTFNVKAGKTYYVFATGSKLGFCGFGFLPQGYSIDANPWLDAPNGIDNPLIDDENNSGFVDAVYAKLPNPDGSYGSNKTVGDNVYDKTTFGGTTITLDANKTKNEVGSFSNQKTTIVSGSNKDHQFVNVNLKRKFKNKRWHGICLPFSVSEYQVKKVFGDSTDIITFDSIRWDRNGVDPGETQTKNVSRTIHFTRHVAQLLEAGRPYFIRPNDPNKEDGEVFQYDDNGKKVDGVQFTHVTFENVDTMNVIGYNEAVMNRTTGADDKDTCFTYKIVGTYNKAPIPFYSYYMKVGNGTDIDEGTDNALVRVVPKNANAKEAYLPGFNAYLYPYSVDANGSNTKLDETSSAKMADFWITDGEVSGDKGGVVTGIDQLVEDINVEQTGFVKGVYTLDGVRVRANTSLKGLAPGVYIMGGKKYTVK